MQRFEPKVIEPKWQKIWDETQIYKADLNSDKPKYIAMSMFNYPSGAGIHIGHAMNYTIPDIMARFKRQQGYESYHPVGWDAFGLPAENYAIKAGVSPQQSMATIIPAYHKQYKAMGWSNDWSKEISTHLPEYYKWTQWIFSEMYRDGLAYQDSRSQWWCTKCQTVLANEQVIDGKCWRHDSADDPEVKRKKVKQWFFKITDYADELLDAIDGLDWTESVKSAQRNWIGRSEGAEVTYKIADRDESITVFTVAHDTMYGTTFLVLAPEHELVKKITTKKQKEEVDSYVREVAKKSEVERQSEKTKTGVFTGAYAINPLSGKKIPIWIADYVLAGYGTGAVMGVPGEDGRDFEFAKKHNLEIIYTTEEQEFMEYHETIQSSPKDYKLANSDEFDGLDFATGRQKILDKLEKTGTGKSVINYKMRDWSISRQRYWGAPIPIVNCVYCAEEEPVIEFEYNNKNNFDSITNGRKTVLTRASDHIIASAKIDDVIGIGYEDRKIFIKVIGKREYANLEERFNDTDWLNRSLPSNFKSLEDLVEYYKTNVPSYLEKIKGKSIVALEYELLTKSVLIPDDQLPVVLPELDDFQPSGDGRSALARATDWIKTTCPDCGGEAERETDTLDTYICSSWYMLRYFAPQDTEQAFDPKVVKKWMPIDFYNGADHATAHLLYARFVTRFFHKKGLVGDPEPFKKFLFNGKITAEDGVMFSKSKGNGVDPLEIINSGYGADALRLYSMFASPLEIWTKWNPNGVPGTYRYLNRLWDMAQEVIVASGSDQESAGGNSEYETILLAELNRTIKKVTGDLERQSYNTAIAKLMELNKTMREVSAKLPYSSPVWREAIEKNLALLAPFAPHMTEELWRQLGHEDSINIDSWPEWDEELVKEDLLTIVVQVNGKLRASLTLPNDASKDELIDAAKADPKVQQHIGGKEIRKTIVVPDRLVNFVV